MKMKIGLIGVGIVGGATKQILSQAHEIYPYDKYKEPYNTEENILELAKNSEIIFICVPTPMKSSGEIDYSVIHNSLSLLENKVKQVKRSPKDILVVIRSTTVSGTTDQLSEKYSFHFAFNPEFLTEKNALEDMKNTDRVVIGANTLEDYKKIEGVYKPLFPDAKYIYVNTKTAEMIKYAANVMLAGQIAVANELYQICKAISVDYDVVSNTILLDGRIGRNIKVPGPDNNLGFGGNSLRI